MWLKNWEIVLCCERFYWRRREDLFATNGPIGLSEDGDDFYFWIVDEALESGYGDFRCGEEGDFHGFTLAEIRGNFD